MSRRPSVETGLRSNGSGGRRAPENGERTPLLSRQDGKETDHDGPHDDQAPLLSAGRDHPQKRRPSLPALKKLEPYPGDGVGARTANAMVRARDYLVETLCCSSVQRWVDRYRNR